MIGIHTDISDRKNSEAQVFQLAHYDSLTGLPNRILFMDRLSQDIRKAERNGHSVTLIFLDLDRFKEVNDALGRCRRSLIEGDRAAPQKLRQVQRYRSPSGW